MFSYTELKNLHDYLFVRRLLDRYESMEFLFGKRIIEFRPEDFSFFKREYPTRLNDYDFTCVLNKAFELGNDIVLNSVYTNEDRLNFISHYIYSNC